MPRSDMRESQAVDTTPLPPLYHEAELEMNFVSSGARTEMEMEMDGRLLEDQQGGTAPKKKPRVFVHALAAVAILSCLSLVFLAFELHELRSDLTTTQSDLTDTRGELSIVESDINTISERLGKV